jgi:hypothetical protein
MYENEKVRPVRTISGIEAGGIKESERGDEFNYDIL